MTEPLRIIELQIENVMHLKVARLKPDGTLVIVEGKNGAGKSSLLTAIAMVLFGGKIKIDRPIRKGKSEALGIVKLGEKVGDTPTLTVTRHWTKTGNVYLEVKGKDGTVVPKTPQKVLDRLFNELSFDPLAFTRMDPKKQAEVLRAVVGLDFEEHDACREEHFDERTEANRRVKTSAAQLQPVAKPADTKRVSTEAIAKRQTDYDDACRLHNKAKGEMEYHLADVQHIEDDLDRVRSTTVSYEEALKASPKPEPQDDLQTALDTAAKHNEGIDNYEAYVARYGAHDALVHEADDLDIEVKRLDQKKADALLGVDFPCDGLSIDETGVTLNGLPLSQASSAESLKVAFSICLAQKPDARVVLCEDGSLLDTESLEELRSIAEQFNAQVFLERVANSPSGDKAAVYIEDGEILEGGA